MVLGCGVPDGHTPREVGKFLTCANYTSKGARRGGYQANRLIGYFRNLSFVNIYKTETANTAEWDKQNGDLSKEIER